MSDATILCDRLRDSRYLNQHFSFESVAAMCEEAADYIETKQSKNQQLTAERDELNKELLRVRTTQQGAAHALDRVRQHMGLDLIEGEHPADTAKRIEAERDAALAEVERLKAMLNHPLLLKVLGDLEDGAGSHDLWVHARSWMDVRDELLKEPANER